MPLSLDVLTVGNAIVDIFARCDDAFLADRDIGKGTVSYTHLTLPTSPHV